MEIKLKHKELNYVVAIVTPHDDPDKTFPLGMDNNLRSDYEIAIATISTFHGDKIFSLKTDNDNLKREIAESYGFYGHLVDIKAISNLDLQSAVRKLPSFEVISIKPAIASSPLPKGAIS